MRPLAVRLELREGLRREALADLLAALGHRVVGGGAAVDLVVRAEAPAEPPQRTFPAVLALRPSERCAVDREPAQALRMALEAGGLAVWSPPLDPQRLAETLRVGGAGERHAEDILLGATFATSAEPWLLVDATSGTACPLNRAAAEAVAAGPPPWSSALPRIVQESEGAVRIAPERGGDLLLWWWSPQAGRRLLACLAWSRIDGVEDLGNLRALADLGRISSTFAHEVRNPLAALASAIDLLGDDLASAERAEVTRLARSRVGTLRTLLDDTLRLVRAFRGSPQPVDLREVVASALAMARSDPEFRGVALSARLPEPCPEALSYAEPLRQALTNLLVNAAQAQHGTGRIDIEVLVCDRQVVLAVEDQGPGIPAEQRDRIFEPFWTTKSAGTGLGLVFVRRVADASHGSIRVAGAQRGTGARFELVLPAA
jgi:signal transduction histidine kinase